MSIKGFLSVLAFATASVVSADVLIWQLGNTVDVGGTQTEYAYAQILASKDGGLTGVAVNNLVGYYEGDVYKVSPSVFDTSKVGAAIPVDMTDSTQHGFYIELFGSTGESVAKSDFITLSQAQLNNFTATADMSAQWAGVNAWHGGTFTAVPEPTSGLLMLLGAAMLGLRRKRVA